MIGIIDFPRLLALPKYNRVVYVLLLRHEYGMVLAYIKTLHFHSLGMRIVYYNQINLEMMLHDLGYNKLKMTDI
jgi:hypothetical protein